MVIFWTGVACASDVIVGSVLAVRGAVFSDAGGGQQPLMTNTPVHLGDTIVSTAGKAKIALDDGTIISVGENSRVRIVDNNNTSNNFKTHVSLISGVLRLLVAKLTPDGRFEVETETAIAAVRGTDWVIEATSEQTSVAVVSGAVAVSNRDGQTQTTVVLDAPGQGTDVRRGSVPTAAAHWGAQRFTNTVARATFE
jgi:hypothetical protein